jgi:hypothetical protein
MNEHRLRLVALEVPNQPPSAPPAIVAVGHRTCPSHDSTHQRRLPKGHVPSPAGWRRSELGFSDDEVVRGN